MEFVERTKQTRRLQLSGGSTFIISLPKLWVENLKLKVGDTVTLVNNLNRSLSIVPNYESQNEFQMATLVLGQKDTEHAIRRKIIATYLAGYKSIVIKSKGIRIKPEYAKYIRDLVRTSMIGTEIVQSNSEKIMIQVLTRLPELSFETALNRMHLMAINMHREAIEALEAGDKKSGDEISNLDNEVDRFSLYMLRNLSLAIENANILHDMGLKKPADCLGYRAVVGRIERVADHAALIGKRIKFLEEPIEPKIMKNLTTLSEGSLKVFATAISALVNKDYTLAENVANEINVIIDENKNFMAKIKDSQKNSTVIKFVLEDIRRIAEYSSDIVEVAIDENIHQILSKN